LIATNVCPYSSHIVVEQRPRWWGSWNIWRVPKRYGPVFSRLPLPGRRAPARACRKQVARWKRRRFVQGLRT
jgi:hypothetical protein